MIFADAAMSVSLADLLGLVDIAGVAADEGFVHFDFASAPPSFTNVPACIAVLIR